MEKLEKEINDFKRLDGIARNINKLSKNYWAYTSKSAHAEELFSGITNNSSGISCFVNELSLQNSEIQRMSSCLATLTRSLMESCELFHYFCMDKISDEEWWFRRSIFWVHMAKEEEKVIDSLGLDRLDNSRAKVYDVIGSMGRLYLLRNEIFNGLSEKYQRSILEGKKPRDLLKSPYVTNPLGLDKKERDGIYRLLSNCAHSTAYGLRVTSGYHPISVDARYIINISILCSIYFLSFSIESYLKKRWRIAKEVSNEDRKFVHQMIVSDFVLKVREMQLEHIKTLKEERFGNT